MLEGLHRLLDVGQGGAEGVPPARFEVGEGLAGAGRAEPVERLGGLALAGGLAGRLDPAALLAQLGRVLDRFGGTDKEAGGDLRAQERSRGGVRGGQGEGLAGLGEGDRQGVRGLPEGARDVFRPTGR
jgi:hypothetical protein